MLKPSIEKALNKQVNEEFYSAYLYLSMSAHFKAINLPGVANWFRIQTQEEIVHAMKFYTFILDRGGRVALDTVAAPETKWKSPLAAFEAAYKHERHITGCINALVDLAIKQSDHAMNTFLQWFVTEQVEEESNADQIVQKLKLVGDNTSALFMVDQELAARVFVPPPAAGAGAP
jgi:ferritin